MIVVVDACVLCVIRSPMSHCNGVNPVAVCDAGLTDRRLPSPSPASQWHAHPTWPSSAADSSHHSVSWSTSDVQTAAVQPSSLASPAARDHDWTYSSLTRGSTRTTDDRLGVWASNTTMTSSLPSLPQEYLPSRDASQTAAEPSVSTKDWLDALHRTKNVLPVHRSTDQVFVNQTGGHQSLTGGSGCSMPSRSTLAGSDESFAVTETSSRQSLNSTTSHDCRNSRSDVSSSKKRRVRFELQPPTTVQSAPAQRQRSRSRTNKQQRTSSNNRSSETDRVCSTDDFDGATASRTSGSLAEGSR